MRTGRGRVPVDVLTTCAVDTLYFRMIVLVLSVSR